MMMRGLRGYFGPLTGTRVRCGTCKREWNIVGYHDIEQHDQDYAASYEHPSVARFKCQCKAKPTPPKPRPVAAIRADDRRAQLLIG